MSISFQHLERLVSGDRGHIHRVEPLFEEPAGGLVPEVVKGQSMFLHQGDLFKEEMGNIRTFSSMFYGNGANLPFLVKINHCVFVQIPRFGYVRFSGLFPGPLRRPLF